MFRLESDHRIASVFEGVRGGTVVDEVPVQVEVRHGPYFRAGR